MACFGFIVNKGIDMNGNNGFIVKSTDVLWHYTDINALTYILDKDFINLRASNCLYLNDGREVEEGLDLIEECSGIQLSKHSFRSYFVSSFSCSSDNLSMWNMYAANGKGCSIGFKPDFLLNNTIFDFWVPCFYNKDEAKLFLESNLALAKHTNTQNLYRINCLEQSISIIDKQALIDNAYIKTALAAKNNAFHEENEFRGVAQSNNNQDIMFREKNGVVIPFINLKIPKDAIVEIKIGPTNKSELTALSVLNMLKIREYNWKNIIVSSSKVPYRG